MKNLIIRSVSGAIFVLLVVGSILISHLLFSLLFLVITFLALREFYSTTKKAGIEVQSTFGTIIGVLIFLILASISLCQHYGLELFYLWSTIIPLLFLFFLVELWRNKSNPFTNIAYTLLGVAYIAIPLGSMNFLLNPEMQQGAYIRSIILGLFALSWSNDTFAYLSGMLFGKHKLFERHSPKKTWEGLIGGIFFNLVFAVILSKLIKEIYLSFYDWIALGLIISIIGTLGDLVESMFKRQFGVKDSGTIMPGHGGILDRLDGIIIVLPFIFFYLSISKNFFSL